MVLDAQMWRGQLPHPDDFQKYPPEIQDKIAEWADLAAKRNDALARTAMELDVADSKRMDAYAEMDGRQIPRAQWMTFGLNFMLLLALLLSVLKDSDTGMWTSVGSLVFMNAANMYIRWSKRQ